MASEGTAGSTLDEYYVPTFSKVSFENSMNPSTKCQLIQL